MTRKRKGLLLLMLYVLLFALAIPLHTQKGIEWNDKFYRQTAENTFSANKNNRFSFTKPDDSYQFDLMFNGYACGAELTETKDSHYQITFDDGFSIVLSGSSWGGISVGGDYFPLSDGTNLIIIDDLSKTPLKFSPYEIETQPIYDGETGKTVIGEWINYKTQDGEHIYGYEKWQDGTQFGTEPTIVTLENGSVIDQDQFNSGNTLYVNAKGELLTNDKLLRSFPYQYSEDRVNRQSACWLMINAALKDRVQSRGHFVCFLMSLLYLLGLLIFLFPEETTFFGSRWQYRYEPELSDAGLFMAKLSGIIIMVMGAAMLFLPFVL